MSFFNERWKLDKDDFEIVGTVKKECPCTCPCHCKEQEEE